jgi:GTP cyclohydrolase I
MLGATRTLKEDLTHDAKVLAEEPLRLQIASPRTHKPPGDGATALDLGELAARLIFAQIGEDQNREGLERTPHRFAKAIREICCGYGETLSDAIGEGVFAAEGNGLVAVRSVEFFSLCEHHILPFWGHVSVAYYPGQRILGLSKVARIVELYSRRLQVQERLTREVAKGLVEAISPLAAGVRIKASHTCMMMRGVEKQASETITEYFHNVESLPALERERLLNSLGN